MSGPPFRVHVRLSGHDRIDFDKRPIRTALRKEAAEVRKIARRLVARAAVSKAGEFPGKTTGDVQRSIKSRLVRRGGLAAIIEPVRTARMDARDFYPSILTYGVPGRIGARKNFIEAAMDARRESARGAILAALQSALIPRK